MNGDSLIEVGFGYKGAFGFWKPRIRDLRVRVERKGELLSRDVIWV